MSMRNFLHYLLLIAHPTVVFLVASLTLGFLLTTYAGLAGIVLAPLLLMWLFNYSYVLLEHIANGAREPPVLAIEMLNPLNEQRPLLQLAIVLLACAALLDRSSRRMRRRGTTSTSRDRQPRARHCV